MSIIGLKLFPSCPSHYLLSILTHLKPYPSPIPSLSTPPCCFLPPPSFYPVTCFLSTPVPSPHPVLHSPVVLACFPPVHICSVPLSCFSLLLYCSPLFCGFELFCLMGLSRILLIIKCCSFIQKNQNCTSN